MTLPFWLISVLCLVYGLANDLLLTTICRRRRDGRLSDHGVAPAAAGLAENHDPLTCTRHNSTRDIAQDFLWN